ncbi:hypothetical protein [uncultured Draconibacterium sp.]|uniref:hypothetical protein n=1 Tax=uncultured Draconibacterium sp. TaxID=1573823 RepID=UPI0025DC96FE|nr:hypothetical protein [uncultured Draconibacterium sp.]
MKITKTGKILLITAALLALILVISGTLIDFENLSERTAKIVATAGYGIMTLVLLRIFLLTRKQK